MKTFVKSISLFIAAIVLTVNVFATGFEMEAEQYVDGIPFNTELIASQALYQQAILQEFQMEGEGFINDIPFNTKSVVDIYFSEQALSQDFTIEEEEYIDDIPFITSEIVLNDFDDFCSGTTENKKDVSGI